MITCGTQVVAGGTGGGSSLPVTTMGALLSGATADRIAATDSGGDGVLLTAAQTRALALAFGSDANGDVMVRAGGVWTRLGVGSDGHVFTVVAGAPAWAASAVSGGGIAARRLAATSDTRLLYECNGSSGVLANTGSLGSAGDLTAGGSCVRNALSARSTIGRGIRGNGSASGGAVGGVALVPTGAEQAFTACVTFVAVTWPGGPVPLFQMDAAVSWSLPYFAFRLSLGLGGVVQAEVRLPAGAHPSPYAGGYGAGQHQAVATYNGSHFRLYVDGALVASSSASGDIQWGSGPWGIAAQGDGGGFDGYVTRAQVDAVAWNADRVAEEWLRTIGDY